MTPRMKMTSPTADGISLREELHQHVVDGERRHADNERENPAAVGGRHG
jgi:hypothetical protein